MADKPSVVMEYRLVIRCIYGHLLVYLIWTEIDCMGLQCFSLFLFAINFAAQAFILVSVFVPCFIFMGNIPTGFCVNVKKDNEWIFLDFKTGPSIEMH